jgi:L(+)-tartrate dehydratase alpha subunit
MNMNKQEQVAKMTDIMARFVDYSGKHLPDDVEAKLKELAAKETVPIAKILYETYARNQKLAAELNRPACQDTGVMQYFVKCGTRFPLIGELEALLKEATVQATIKAPLRHNSVETFDEYNTGKNVGKGTPTVFWEIVPDADTCEIDTYMAGGGCTLPGHAMVLMPGEGYEGRDQVCAGADDFLWSQRLPAFFGRGRGSHFRRNRGPFIQKGPDASLRQS